MAKGRKGKVASSGERLFRISASQALRVAEMQIEKYQRLKEWNGAYAVDVFPLYLPLDKKEPSYFEVKISTPSVDDAGTVIISATDNNFPIIGFRTRGRTLTEKAIAKSGYEVKRLIWHGLNAVSGIDKEGKEIIRLGHKPEEVFNLEKYEEMRKKRKEKPLPKPLPEPKKSEELQEEWKEVKKALGLTKSNPSGVTADSFRFAWGWSRHANLDQYELSNGEMVGCGPTAWTALLAYHDLRWDPDWLYGTHNFMSSDYLKRSMKKFHDRMGTQGGSTWAWNMAFGFLVFKDYHYFGDFYFDLDDYDKWDPVAFLFGGEPGENIQNLILEMINWNIPIIVGLVIERSWIGVPKGHYCLGLGWAKNANGKLKYVLCDELHGEGLEDLFWWHRDNVFGAWAIPRSAFQPRKSVESNVWEDIDLANFNNEIYAVGRKHIENWPDPNPPVFVIKRGPAAGFPIPVKGTNAKKLEFSKSVELPVYELQGSEVYPFSPSITTWNYKTTTINIEVSPGPVIRAADSTEERSDVFTIEEVRKYLSERPFTATIKRVKWETSETPYLFLVWADWDGRIHVAYAKIPDDLSAVSFTHVLLPERFRVHTFSGGQTDIAIAQDDKTGPVLYIAYCGGDVYLGNSNLVPDCGGLLIINLDLFFKIAETGEDLWPQDSLPNVTYATEMGMQVLTDFKWHWARFRSNVQYVRLSSNGKKVALLWSEEYINNLHIYSSYTFETEVQSSTSLRVNWGDCKIVIPYAKYGERFLNHSSHIGNEGDWALGDIQSTQCDIFYVSDYQSLIVWTDPDGNLDTANVRISDNVSRAELVSDFFSKGWGPRLAFVRDQLNNLNIVMAYRGGANIYSRILYLGAGPILGITDFDDLPK